MKIFKEIARKLASIRGHNAALQLLLNNVYLSLQAPKPRASVVSLEEVDCEALLDIANAASAARASQQAIYDAANAALNDAIELENIAWNYYITNCDGGA